MITDGRREHLRPLNCVLTRLLPLPAVYPLDSGVSEKLSMNLRVQLKKDQVWFFHLLILVGDSRGGRPLLERNCGNE